ncbi:MAG: hypothetical protein ACI8XC_002004 [Gammaproteobacteria bacterium]|jgi:hypothetical protein
MMELRCFKWKKLKVPKHDQKFVWTRQGDPVDFRNKIIVGYVVYTGYQ